MEIVDSGAPVSALKSSFYEQLVEHVFISEILQEAWYRHRETVEVLRSEVDASGYDVVLECNGVLRHVQLKTSVDGGRTGSQKVNVALAEKPSVWLLRAEVPEACRIRLGYRFFGGGPGKPLPPLDNFRVARHTKANSTGMKAERPAIRVVPKGSFDRISNLGDLLQRLFGISS
jgi:hypothetical protein